MFREGEAVLNFLVEAILLCAKQPHKLYETYLAVYPGKDMGFSLLVIAALRQSMVIMGSKKMAKANKNAILLFSSGKPNLI